jgi:hypothetical protein
MKNDGNPYCIWSIWCITKSEHTHWRSRTEKPHGSPLKYPLPQQPTNPVQSIQDKKKLIKITFKSKAKIKNTIKRKTKFQWYFRHVLSSAKKMM